MLDEADLNLPKGLTAEDVDHLAHKYLAHGETRMGHAELRALGEQSKGTNTGAVNIQQGFYLAPSKFSSECVYRIRALNPFRSGGAMVFKDCGYSLTLPVTYTDIDATVTVRTDVTATGGDGSIAMSEFSATPKFNLPLRDATDPPTTPTILYPKPRYVYFRVSRELLEDTSENNGVALEKILGNMAAQAFVEREMIDIIRGNASGTDVTTEKIMGIVPQLAALSRSSAAMGVTAASITAAKLSLMIETLSSGRFARSLWLMHPRLLGIFSVTVDPFFYSSAYTTDTDGTHHTCMSLFGRPLYMEPLMLATAALTATTRPGILIDPSAVVIAESGPPVALRRLDELGAGTNEVLFQAVRRYDTCLADIYAASALLL